MRATAQRTTAQDGISYEVRRQLLEDGAETTAYVVRYPAATTSLRVAQQHLEIRAVERVTVQIDAIGTRGPLDEALIDLATQH